jgi:hypothetical protein
VRARLTQELANAFDRNQIQTLIEEEALAHYVEIDANNQVHHLNYAPYLNYRPLREDDSTSSPAGIAAGEGIKMIANRL